MSGVDESLINNAIIAQTGAPLGTSGGIAVPSYDPNEGGGAMTLPDEYGLGIKRIIYTKNFFSSDNEKYRGNAYAYDMMSWLDLSSHEVGHLPQIDQYKGNYMPYVSASAKEYLRTLSHDNSKFEKEADKGRVMFRAFNKYVNKNYGKNRISKLFSNPHNKQENIKKMVDKWWNNFKKNQRI